MNLFKNNFRIVSDDYQTVIDIVNATVIAAIVVSVVFNVVVAVYGLLVCDVKVLYTYNFDFKAVCL